MSLDLQIKARNDVAKEALDDAIKTWGLSATDGSSLDQSFVDP